MLDMGPLMTFLHWVSTNQTNTVKNWVWFVLKSTKAHCSEGLQEHYHTLTQLENLHAFHRSPLLDGKKEMAGRRGEEKKEAGEQRMTSTKRKTRQSFTATFRNEERNRGSDLITLLRTRGAESKPISFIRTRLQMLPERPHVIGSYSAAPYTTKHIDCFCLEQTNVTFLTRKQRQFGSGL